jgi:uncharacterized RDD family membrane protein YckC
VSTPEISPVPREARPFQGETAGVVTRVVANSIDAALVGVMVGACYLGMVSVTFLLDPRNFQWPDGHFLAGLTFALGLSVVYLWLSWWLWGRSYGKHVMGIRVAGRRGHKLGPVRALGRAAFCVFFPIGFFWCVISPRRHSVQDIAVYSAVVYDWMPHPSVAADTPPTSAPDATVERAVAEPLPPSGSVAVEATVPEAPLAGRRYRWARAVDPYDD